MAFTQQDIDSNRDWFQRKVRAEKEKNTVIHWVKDEPGGGDFVLLDVRSRGAFRKAHIRGAVCVPLEELNDLVGKLPRDRELVTYCWNDTWQLSAKAALQLAERGFFCKEMNAGWSEWTAADLPTHSAKVEAGEIRCECSK